MESMVVKDNVAEFSLTFKGSDKRSFTNEEFIKTNFRFWEKESEKVIFIVTTVRGEVLKGVPMLPERSSSLPISSSLSSPVSL